MLGEKRNENSGNEVNTTGVWTEKEYEESRERKVEREKGRERKVDRERKVERKREW